MRPRLDIVGHFGTTYSYATVAANVARALHDAGYLGSVTNLDPEWHPSHADLDVPVQELGTHVFVVAAPYHYLDAYSQMYTRERSAIFMSPNTDMLSAEHAKTCAKFGLAVAPSRWCERVVRNNVSWAGLLEAEVICLPLGVADELLAGRAQAMAERWNRLPRGPRLLHFSTDQYWPGRKGTEALIEAWGRLLVDDDPLVRSSELLVHVPPALYPETMHRLRQLDLDDRVSLRRGIPRGGSTGDLEDLFEWADVLVAPSRCEGFGIMLLSALASGLPLLTTYATGQQQFLSELRGWLGVPTGPFDDLAGEQGKAPTINADILASTLRTAMLPDARRLMMVDAEKQAEAMENWSWSSRAAAYRDALVDWMKREI